MNNNLEKGKLKRWNDSKGFGFIATDNGRDIFIHISALARMGRRPVIGDVIIFQVHEDNDGKRRAVNAKIAGVAEVSQRPVRKAVKKQKNGGWLFRVIPIVLFITVGSFAYNKFFAGNKPHYEPTTTASAYVPKIEKNNQYSCAGKVFCSEMTSCAEAKFYQKHCPGTKMDGDRDGIPCESQWCK